VTQTIRPSFVEPSLSPFDFPPTTSPMDWENLIFNIAAFIAALFLLEWGADRFVDHTVVVAHRLRVSSSLVALLTAGAEWEEVQKRPLLLY
jgi:hypothetical protein